MKDKQLPNYFKQLFWSQDYLTLDLNNDKKTIIVNTINYGDFTHWKWIKLFYGEEEVKNTLMKLLKTEIREHVQPLVKLIFSIPDFNHAQRSTN